MPAHQMAPPGSMLMIQQDVAGFLPVDRESKIAIYQAAGQVHS